MFERPASTLSSAAGRIDDFSIPQENKPSATLKINGCISFRAEQLERDVMALTSNVISRTFFVICRMPESPSSPDTHSQGLDVVIALLSFLMGMITALYGITSNAKKNKLQINKALYKKTEK